MEAFATVDDYKRRFGEVNDESLLNEALIEASELIAAEMRAAGVSVADPDDDLKSALMTVCRRMANRALEEPSVEEWPVPAGVSQLTHSIGDFSKSFTLSNPTREMYLTKSDRVLLGIPKRCRVRFFMPGFDIK